MSEEDIVLEPEHNENTTVEPEAKIKSLKEKLKKAETEKQEYLSGWQKERANIVNLRKRDEEDRKAFAKYAVESVVEDIIPVLDSFDMAMGNQDAWKAVTENWRVGVEQILNQLKSILQKHGVTEIYPLGEKFDVHKHEAVEHTLVTSKDQDHTVIKVHKRGYVLHDRILRPAQVTVGEYKK